LPTGVALPTELAARRVGVRGASARIRVARIDRGRALQRRRGRSDEAARRRGDVDVDA
jgi:hypothetical protein